MPLLDDFPPTYTKMVVPLDGGPIFRGAHDSLYASRYFQLPASRVLAEWETSTDAAEIFAWVDACMPRDTDRAARITIQCVSPLYAAPHVFHIHRAADSDAIDWDYEPRPNRTCTRCGERLPGTLDNFYRRGADGLSSWCRNCSREYAATRRRLKRDGRRFGVEIEFLHWSAGEGSDDCDCEECASSSGPGEIADALREAGIDCDTPGYTHEVMGCWKIVRDASVTNGWELVSPPLLWAQRDQIETVCRVLRELGAEVDDSCGLHVHHEVSDLTLAAFKRLVNGWDDWQDYTDCLVSPSRRDGAYCGHFRADEITSVEMLDRLSDIPTLGLDRYRALNLTCFGQYGTVEIRQHQGTINADKILAWIAYGQAVIAAATSGTPLRAPLPQPNLFGEWHRPVNNVLTLLDALPFREDADHHREYLKNREAEWMHA
jgi:hypothetical protein